VHADHSDHVDVAQLTAHAARVHVCASLSTGQSPADLVTMRCRVCMPVPHDSEHIDHADHADTSHEHAGRVHARASLRASHAAPPAAGATTTLRVRRSSPAPHVCEHMPQFVHADSEHATGHAAAAEQSSVCASSGHAAPPHAGCTVAARVRVRFPPLPHVTLQLVHAAQPPTAHDAGQQPVPHGWLSTSPAAPGHGAALPVAAFVTVRVRCCVPPPHVAVHAVNTDHGDSSHAVPHAPRLHALFSVSAGQSAAPAVIVRVRVITPSSHVFVHVDHAVHALTAHAHATTMHGRVSTFNAAAGHGVPPFAAGVTTDRVRRSSPAPHACEHVDHAVNADITQFTGQLATLHGSDSVVAGHVAPLHAAAVVTGRVRVRMPAPHVVLHADQFSHAPTAHATGQHVAVLHASLADKSLGHGAPPLTGSATIVRARERMPDGPHDAEHAVHDDQSLTTQSDRGAGHAPGLHGSLSVLSPLHTPPHDADTVGLRERTRVPVPHVTEQPVNIDHGPHWQFTGQQPPLAVQPRFSVSTSHEPPHNAATVTVRVRDCDPPPQVTEHPPQPDHCVSWQSCAQHAAPQGCVCNRSVGHAMPPQEPCTATVRERDCWPPPHAGLQLLHDVQRFIAQCTGQQPVLHGRSSTVADSEHVPPHNGGVMLRDRDCIPPPHAAVQVLHSPQPPIWQFCGQQPLLQSCVCETAASGQLPPHSAACIERERD
jgi:hypothetical protein